MSLELFFSIAGFTGVLIGGAYALMKVIVRQFKEDMTLRFEAHTERLASLEADIRRNERGLLELRAELPISYVRREDHIRFETVITAKLDALYSKMELVAERQKGA